MTSKNQVNRRNIFPGKKETVPQKYKQHFIKRSVKSSHNCHERRSEVWG